MAASIIGQALTLPMFFINGLPAFVDKNLANINLPACLIANPIFPGNPNINLIPPLIFFHTAKAASVSPLAPKADIPPPSPSSSSAGAGKANAAPAPPAIAN